MAKYVYIRELGTDKAIHHIDVSLKSERFIDRMVDGMMINLDHEHYYIDDTCKEESEPETKE